MKKNLGALFEAQQKVKYNVLNIMSTPLLSDLSLLCIESERLKEIRNEDIFDQFAQNTRRLELF